MKNSNIKDKFKQKSLWWVILLAILAFWLRFHQLHLLFHYTLDEEYWSYVAHNVATVYHWPLIGGPIGGTGLYLGPLFVWVCGFVFWLIGSSPFVLAAVVAGMGVVTTVLIYTLLRRHIGQVTAGLASLLYASSAWMVMYDKKFWNASPIPLLSVLLLWLVYQIKHKPRLKLAVLMGVVAGFAVQAHMSGLVLVVYGLLVLLTYKVTWRFWLVYLLVVIGLHLPVMGFELRHNFTNFRALVTLLSQSQSENQEPRYVEILQLPVVTIARFMYTPAIDVADELTLCSQMAGSRRMPPVIYISLALAVLVYGVNKLRASNPFSLLLVTNIGLVAVYMIISPNNFYPGQLSEYYFLPSIVAVAVLVAQLSVALYQKVPLVTLGFWIMLVLANLHIVGQLTHTHSLPSKYQTVEAVIGAVGDKPFYLDVVGHPCQIYGYRFLFTYMGTEPSRDYLGDNFVWLFERRRSVEEPELAVTIDADTGSFEVQQL